MNSKIDGKVSKIEETMKKHKTENQDIQECVQKVEKIPKQLDEQNTDTMQMRGCIQEAVQVTLKEDKDEDEMQLKRCTSVMV